MLNLRCYVMSSSLYGVAILDPSELELASE